MFIRSMVTSQISSNVDYILSFVFFAWVGFNSFWSTTIGAVVGGVVNCMINYKFTFRMRESSYLAIGIKFFIVWLGSWLLNSFGTAGMTAWLTNSPWLDDLGVAEDLRFAVARLFTALVVSVFWNFILQRFFVFRSTKFDNLIDRIHYILAFLFPHRRKA